MRFHEDTTLGSSKVAVHSVSSIVDTKQLSLGVLCLAAGALEYLVDRPIGSTYFLNEYEAIHVLFHHFPSVYGSLGAFAPGFFHSLAFSLLGMAFVSTLRNKVRICIAWFVIDSLFELGQIATPSSLESLREQLAATPVINGVIDYFAFGTFDLIDLGAIGSGSLTAILLAASGSRLKE